MQIKHSIIIVFLCAVMQMYSCIANAGSVTFSGYVPQRNGDAGKTIEHAQTMVSFSDEVALTIPLDFASDGDLRIFNDHGEINSGLRLLSLATERGVNTRVAVVDLTRSLHQTFLLCDGHGCIRYKVIRP